MVVLAVGARIPVYSMAIINDPEPARPRGR